LSLVSLCLSAAHHRRGAAPPPATVQLQGPPADLASTALSLSPTTRCRWRSPPEPEKRKRLRRSFRHRRRFRPPFNLKLGSLDSYHHKDRKGIQRRSLFVDLKLR
ncbi:hypothetical protein TorRG33x02_293460, partial [Trema orientale]